jgi:hypothetical protein
MQRIQFFVTLYNSRWHVSHGGSRYGPYGTQADAIAAAKTWAKATPNSQVLVQGADGLFRTEWTYGNDPKKYVG